MQYTLLFFETAPEQGRRNTPEAPAYWGAWNAYMGAMSAAGVMRSGNGLLGPDTATTLRISDGKWEVQDGPFADTKEQLGGYVVLDVSDLDEALQWAARAPCAGAGSVEVRPVMPAPAA